MSQSPRKYRKQQGFLLATLIAFIPLITILSVLAISLPIQSHQTTIRQELVRQAQLAAASAMDYAKEQYELNLVYNGTAEATLYETDGHIITYEVVSKGYSNTTNTQQDIQGIGRVYAKSDATTALFTREIQGKITNTTSGTSSARFIFIIDNSGSMSASEWLQSKTTVDAAINYVLDNVPTAEVAILQYGTNNNNQEHKYDVTVPFTDDATTAITWDRRYGPGSSSTADFQDHLPGSLARMRADSVYGPGDALDLGGATNVQYVLFTDARGAASSGGCCSSLKKLSGEPSFWNTGSSAAFPVFNDYEEYNRLKNGSVFTDDGYPGLISQFTVLSVYDDDNSIATTSNAVRDTRRISAAIASTGGSWITGGIDVNAGDPEGEGLLPRRLIATTLAAGPDEIIQVLQEVIEDEINF